MDKGSPCGDTWEIRNKLQLQSGFDFEAPGFEQRFRDIFRVLVAACPLAKAGGAQILVGGQLVFAHDLLELGNGGDDGPNRLRLAPVGISSTLCHETAFPTNEGMNSNSAIYMILRLVSRMREKRRLAG